MLQDALCVGQCVLGRDTSRAWDTGRIDSLVSAGEKIPAGNEKKIPAGDGDPFSL